MKIVLIYFSFITTLFAQCSYKANIEIFPDKNKLFANIEIKNSEQNISIDLDGFKIKKKLIKESNKISLSYEKILKKQIEKDFIFLSSSFLPKINSLCKYELNLTLPKEFIALSESEEIKRVNKGKKTTYNFKINKPIDNINIIASKDFVIESEVFNDIEISTYFFKQHSNLSSSYIKKVKHYIKMYENMLGEFPYKTFRVVENSFQTGYSMPTYTLIGSRIIDKDFLIDISLGHEILHQWFGNSVFNDFSKGNWVEGLTSYLADHHYMELDKKGWEYRKKFLDDYASYVNEKNIFLLKDFTHRYDKPSMVIGYGKGAFAFHTLRKKVGDELFFDGLKAFYKEYKTRYATYKNIDEFFTDFTKINTSEVFHNSFEHLDIVDFKAENISVLYDNGKYNLTFDIALDINKSHTYKLPLLVQTEDANESFMLDINGSKTISLLIKDRPLKLIFDKNYDLFRTLKEDENIPNIAKLLADTNLSIVTNNMGEFNKLEKLFPNSKQIKIDDLTFKQMESKNILFLKDAKDLAQKSLAKLPKQQKGLFIICEKNPWNRSKVVSYLYIENNDERKALRKLPHYTKYSNLHFKNAHLEKKSIQKTQKGDIYTVVKEQLGIKTSKNLSLKEIVNEIVDKKIIFIGESHTNFAHHINQLNIIKELHKKGKKVVIGMEMFQRKFQGIVDEYIEGKLDEKTFLEKSEYFTRWKFNYNLYKPILDYAKENSIRVIALNLDKEIIKKVTKSGFYALSDKEKELLPKSIDFTNQTYKNSLKTFFSSSAHLNASHKNGAKNINTDFVYQSQIIWDETMAESISIYLEENEDIDSFVVLAGTGHIEGFHGIPDRVFRRVSLPFSVILQDMPATAMSADFVLFPQKLKVKEPMKIGVFLDTSENLKVIKLVKNSIASELGIKKDDIILEVDDVKVKNLDEMKFILFFKLPDEKIKIKIKRGKKTLTFEMD